MILNILLFVHGITAISAESILLLGGEVDSILHPSIAEVEAYGACGLFDAGIPELPKNLREFAAALYGDQIVACGGYGLLGAVKDCFSLTLGEWPPVWNNFASLNTGRHNHGMAVVGGELYVVGGSTTIGSVRSIERYNPEAGTWEDFSEVVGYRQDFCLVPWGEDKMVLIGGYDAAGNQVRVEMFNTVDMTWKVLAPLNVGRGMHACTWHNGMLVTAGGWSPDNDPVTPGQLPTSSVEWYNVENNTWTEGVPMRHRRTEFGLVSLNGVLTAFGGFEGDHLDTVERYMEEEEGWEYDDALLSQKKSGFAVASAQDYLADMECQ